MVNYAVFKNTEGRIAVVRLSKIYKTCIVLAVVTAMLLSFVSCSESDEEKARLDEYELKLAGKAVDIPPKELELLYFLASNYNRVFTRDQLLDKVWGFDYLGDSRTVDVHVKRLREKLEGVSDKWLLKTVWGVGYKFELLS